MFEVWRHTSVAWLPQPKEMHAQHLKVMEDDELLSRRRVVQIREEGEVAISAAHARASDARQQREDIEAQIEEINEEMRRLMEREEQQREALASQLNSADIRTARAVMDVDLHVQALRGEAENVTRSTFQGLQQENHHAWALQDKLGGLKEAVTGVTACQRDQQLQRAPKVSARPFDLEETPFDGLGKFGSSRPQPVPKGFYAEAEQARAVNAARGFGKAGKARLTAWKALK